MELVELIDESLDLVDRDQAYAHFMRVGQMAVVDDFVEIRPDQRDRFQAAARSGRLLMGPWYILMDEFLVSGETIVRDLALGMERAEAFGGHMPVGYLPDMFGHIAQMPQILRGFGLDSSVVWRGVPAACTEAPSFVWEALDGSSVIAQYLPRGYGNGFGLPPDAASLVRRIELFCGQTGGRSGGDGEPVLWMHGTDHQHPLPHLPAMVADANALQDDWHLVISTLPAYIDEQTMARTATTHWRGELRSGARANMLMGVASNRVDVKQAAARAERTIERLAEPLSALFLTPAEWPAPFLDAAWKLMIQNAAHDSICACSHDDVVLAVRDRFAEAQAIGDGLIERANLGALRLARDAFEAADGVAALVVNPTARRRSGVVELLPTTEELIPGTQDLWSMPGRLPMIERPARDACEWMSVVCDNVGDVHAAEVTDAADGSVDVELLVDPRRFGLLDPTEANEHLARVAAVRPDAVVRFWYCGRPSRAVLAYADGVPGFGWSMVSPLPDQVQPVVVDASGRGLSNGVLTVSVADDGTYAIDGHTGLGRLVDDGDRGDTYNWCPPAVDTVVDRPEDVAVSVLESGPLRARLRIDATFRWPTQVFGDERTGDVRTHVATTLELQAGQDLLHVEVAFENRSRDHRLRTWFPLPQPSRRSGAECAFGIVERGLDAEGGPTESPLATHPSRRFVTAGGLTVAHEGLVEYELVDIRGDGEDRRAHALALTLVRSTGMLSQIPMETRPLPAGPFDKADDAQLQRSLVLRYAVHTGTRNPYAVTDDAFVPLQVVGTTHGAGRRASDVPTPEAATSQTLLQVDGAEVSALRRLASRPEVFELRVFNPTGDPVDVTIAERSGLLVDLRGNGEQRFDRSFTLRPWGIQTVHLDP
jgi:hypothetical protein